MEKRIKTTALIMAGGKGERFWPKSRMNLPKQFLSLTEDGKTMIQLTVDRIRAIVDMEDIFIVTNKDYKNLVLEQLPGIPVNNVLCEPIGRNTAACIGLGAIHITYKYNDALMIVLPSDHLLKCNNMFIQTLQYACEVAEKNKNLVTIGIKPNYPEIGYGYIKFTTNICEGKAFLVEKFEEKPNLETAKKYLESEEYLWNSGMFVWKVSSILSSIKCFMPNMYQGLIKIKEAFGTNKQDQVLYNEFVTFDSQSIDYGIMEKSKNIYVIPGNFGWDDVGSWLALDRLKKANKDGNVLNGNIITINSKKCIIQGESKLIAAVGLENLIIVDTSDSILICSKKHSEEIKKVVENLKLNNHNEYM